MTVARDALSGEPFAAFVATDLRVKPATEAWERKQYFALRRAVFTDEQALLAQDRDVRDFEATAIVALTHLCGQSEQVVGAVRIYPAGEDLWYGGRLCVAREFRRQGAIGKALINEAVALAIERGCRRFLATVQCGNERYFRALHWHTIDTLALHGQSHCLMQADLRHYPFMPRNAPLPFARGGHARHA